MGVPKFYRWISERYPCLSEIVREYQIPEFDNLYLDMNGIIHHCSHPNDEDPHFRITEEKIFSDIFHYIEILYKMIRPRKVFFMAVDGVAPRAKMNQQRGRRFRSAREAEEAEKRAVERGETLPKEDRFDSNCITPGTVFMARLHEQLKYFVTMKISTDTTWQGVRIYLSGHETPGEGEHKIMDFIRHEKSKPDYDPNTRHCLYGLDADLIMLGLCTHEPHFSLLREEVRFGGKKSQTKCTSPEETTFHLLHLSLMREYIDYEFSALKSKLSFPYDLEKVIDDWVMMGFLVGNDFIPHLPHMHIAHDALPMLYKTYVDVLPTLDGFINEGGFLNLARFEKYLERVSEFDYEKFNDSYADLKWLESKGGQRKESQRKNNESKASEKKKKINTDSVFDVLAGIGDDDFQDGSDCEVSALQEKEDLVRMDDSSDDDDDDDEEEEEPDEVDTEEDLFEMEFRQHKRDYYMNKLDYANVTADVLADQTQCYIRAIQWNLHYYYNSVCSWSWYYPHHYAPYISDVKNFSKQKLDYDLGKPFLPFQQLLAVLPAASKKLLPLPYQNLMSQKDSPVIDFYPVDFKTDLNGKQQDWEAVVLIPFINEKRLLDAMEPLESQMTLDEKQRNRHGPCNLYTYSSVPKDTYKSSLPSIYPDVAFNHANCEELDREAFYVEPSKLRKGLCEGAITDTYYLGFPTMKHILHRSELKKANVKVFQMQSRKESMVLHVTANPSPKDLDVVAKEYLGQTVYVSWPHLVEAKVVELSDYSYRYIVSEHSNKKQPEVEVEKHKQSNKDSEIWINKASSVQERLYERWGLKIEEIAVLVSATPLIGKRHTCTSNGKVVIEKQYTSQPLNFAFQTIVKDLKVHETSVKEVKNVEELYQSKMTCFMLGTLHYGCIGEVEEVTHKRKVRVLVNLTVPKAEPNIEAVFSKKNDVSVQYMKGYTAAQRLGISTLLLSRITGTFFIILGSERAPTNQKINIGLNLKFNKKNEEVPGYTKKTEDGWLYSTAAVEVMAEYLERFPDVFDHIAYHLEDSSVFTEELYPGGNSGEKVRELQDWLKSQHFNKVQHQKCGTDVIDEPIVKLIEDVVDKYKESDESETRRVKMQVRRNHLYVPKHIIGSMIPDPNATYKLYDRVVVVREDYSVPIGCKGTVTGIYQAEKELDTLYDVVFDEEFVGGLTLRCSPNRGYRLPCFALINISHGMRQEKARAKLNNKPTAVVHPQAAWTNDSILLPETIVVNNTNNKTAAMGRVHDKGPSTRYFTRQNSGYGAQNALQANKLNHSPLSPFIPRQTMPKQRINLGNTINQTQDLQHQGKKQQAQNPTDNEFLSFWKELKIGSNANQASQQASSKSDFDFTNSLYDTRWNQRQGDPHILQRPAQPKQTFVSAPPHQPPNTADEFSSMLKALSESSQSEKDKTAKKQKSSAHTNYQVAGTTTLLQLLNIKQNDDDDNHCEKEQNRSTASAKQEEIEKRNRKLKEARKAENHQAVPMAGPPMKLLATHSATWELMTLVQKMFTGAVPVYTYMNCGPSQSKLAQVKLPDGSAFCGLACLTKEEAGESAAIQALNVLKERLEAVDKMTTMPPNCWPMGSNPFRPQLPPGLGYSFPNVQPAYFGKSLPRHPSPSNWAQQPCIASNWFNGGGEILHPSPEVIENRNCAKHQGHAKEFINRNLVVEELGEVSRNPPADSGSLMHSPGVFVTPCIRMKDEEKQAGTWGFSGHGAQTFFTPFVPMQVMKQNISVAKKAQQKQAADPNESSFNDGDGANAMHTQTSHDTNLDKNLSNQAGSEVKVKKTRIAAQFSNMM